MVGAYGFWPGRNLYWVMPAVKRSLRVFFSFFFFCWSFFIIFFCLILKGWLYQWPCTTSTGYIDSILIYMCRSLQEISNVFYCTVHFYPDMNEFLAPLNPLVWKLSNFVQCLPIKNKCSLVKSCGQTSAQTPFICICRVCSLSKNPFAN